MEAEEIINKIRDLYHYYKYKSPVFTSEQEAIALTKALVLSELLEAIGE